MNKKIIIALDGPAGSGKTTSARLVAEKLGYIYIDTGAMYRAVTLACLRSGIEINDSEVEKLMESISINLRPSESGQITELNGEDVSLDIRRPEVTKWVSPVSAMGCVRDKMVAQQREIGKNGGVVMDGRDIGTVVFPQAELKFYLIASIESRSLRRAKELKEKGIEQAFEEIRDQIANRDIYDSSRAISPLRKADDAIELDTSNISIDEQVNIILKKAEEIISKNS